ncbi:MAG: hypothetical protein EXR61_04980 [Chloroflexi bacterium]|nr:hypothetical protein [Chloroflexota bacterium]
MPLTLADDPPDRLAWIAETIRLLASGTAEGRASLLRRLGRATEAELLAGTVDDWGLGQIATHLLVVERAVALIALRLARGEGAGATGQPRPGPGEATRESVRALADKAEQAILRLGREFPTAPDTRATATHPYYGELNCFGWLLLLPNHYRAHLAALDAGELSVL